MWSSHRQLSLLLFVVVLAGCPGRTDPDDETRRVSAEQFYDTIPQEDTQRCISVSRLNRVEPIGNHTLLFHVGRDEVWRNRLRSPCPGVNPHTRFLVEPRAGRLCSLDTVHALIDDGFGYRRGSACSLGEFDLLDEEEQAAVRQLQ